MTRTTLALARDTLLIDDRCADDCKCTRKLALAAIDAELAAGADAGRLAYTTEHHIALREAHCISMGDAFWKVRLSVRDSDREAAFDAGFTRGFDIATKLADERAALARPAPAPVKESLTTAEPVSVQGDAPNWHDGWRDGFAAGQARSAQTALQEHADLSQSMGLYDVGKQGNEHDWRVAEVWSSPDPDKKVPWLSVGEAQHARVETHSSFIRWLAEPPPRIDLEQIAQAIEHVERPVLAHTTFEYWFNSYCMRNGLVVSSTITNLVKAGWNEACLAAAKLVRGFSSVSAQGDAVDAARYHWIRDSANATGHGAEVRISITQAGFGVDGYYDEDQILNDEEADRVIDAARAQQGGQG